MATSSSALTRDAFVLFVAVVITCRESLSLGQTQPPLESA